MNKRVAATLTFLANPYSGFARGNERILKLLMWPCGICQTATLIEFGFFAFYWPTINGQPVIGWYIIGTTFVVAFVFGLMGIALVFADHFVRSGAHIVLNFRGEPA